MTLPTPASLQKSKRRLDRLLREAETALSAMRDGAVLHLHYRRHGPCWSLSDGSRVADDAASVIIKNPRVKPDNDALFGEALSQTWRYVR